jgi:hypothetical protein|uniref:Uncharacterized protein n=1 Tax=Populus trichocarpa TaxID=3694 RepID=A0A3N7GQD7_POPTR
MSGTNKTSGITGGGGDASKAPSSGAPSLVSVSGSVKDATMKAPGQDVRKPRDAFEKNPSGYFHDWHKK